MYSVLFRGKYPHFSQTSWHSVDNIRSVLYSYRTRPRHRFLYVCSSVYPFKKLSTWPRWRTDTTEVNVTLYPRVLTTTFRVNLYNSNSTVILWLYFDRLSVLCSRPQVLSHELLFTTKPSYSTSRLQYLCQFLYSYLSLRVRTALLAPSCTCIVPQRPTARQRVVPVFTRPKTPLQLEFRWPRFLFSNWSKHLSPQWSLTQSSTEMNSFIKKPDFYYLINSFIFTMSHCHSSPPQVTFPVFFFFSLSFLFHFSFRFTFFFHLLMISSCIYLPFFYSSGTEEHSSTGLRGSVSVIHSLL